MNLTLRIMAPPVECPKQKQGSPGLSANTFSRNDFCIKQVKTL